MYYFIFAIKYSNYPCWPLPRSLRFLPRFKISSIIFCPAIILALSTAAPPPSILLIYIRMTNSSIYMVFWIRIFCLCRFINADFDSFQYARHLLTMDSSNENIFTICFLFKCSLYDKFPLNLLSRFYQGFD